MSSLLILLGSFFVSAIATGFLIRFGGKVIPLDTPNQRSLHVTPTPRSGGLAVVTGAMLGGGLLTGSGLLNTSAILFGLGGLILFIVALLDDRSSLSPLFRLIVHFLAAFLLLLSLIAAESSFHEHGVLTFVVGLIVIVWAINLYNFMDGMDGFAATMAIIGFGTLALLGWWAGRPDFALIVLVPVASSLGFLRFNFPPASIFLGDVGSTFLGYAMAAASLWGIAIGVFAWWIPLIIFAPFWVDASFTLLRRLLCGEKVWVAHREHWYQKAVLSGHSVRRVLLIEIVVMLVCSGLAVAGSIV